MSIFGDDHDATSPVKKGRDNKVDWFHFETRMRKVIQEMLDPVIQSNDENSDHCKILEQYHDELRDKFQDSEFRIKRLETGTVEFINLDKRINELRTETQISIEQTKHDMQSVRAEIAEIKNMCSFTSELSRTFQATLEKNNGEISTLNEHFFDLKDSSHEQILKISEEISNSTTDLNTRIDEFKLGMTDIKSIIENIQKTMDKYHVNLSDSQAFQKELAEKIKKNFDTSKFDTQIDKLSNEFDNSHSMLENLIKDNNQKIYYLEEYLDKYMPMKIQSTISGTMAPVLSSKKRNKLNNMLQSKLQKLTTNLASEKEANIEEKLNRMARATGRDKFEYKQDIMSNSRASFYSGDNNIMGKTDKSFHKHKKDKKKLKDSQDSKKMNSFAVPKSGNLKSPDRKEELKNKEIRHSSQEGSKKIKNKLKLNLNSKNIKNSKSLKKSRVKTNNKINLSPDKPSKLDTIKDESPKCEGKQESTKKNIDILPQPPLTQSEEHFKQKEFIDKAPSIYNEEDDLDNEGGESEPEQPESKHQQLPDEENKDQTQSIEENKNFEENSKENEQYINQEDQTPKNDFQQVVETPKRKAKLIKEASVHLNTMPDLNIADNLERERKDPSDHGSCKNASADTIQNSSGNKMNEHNKSRGPLKVKRSTEVLSHKINTLPEKVKIEKDKDEDIPSEREYKPPIISAPSRDSSRVSQDSPSKANRKHYIPESQKEIQNNSLQDNQDVTNNLAADIESDNSDDDFLTQLSRTASPKRRKKRSIRQSQPETPSDEHDSADIQDSDRISNISDNMIEESEQGESEEYSDSDEERERIIESDRKYLDEKLTSLKNQIQNLDTKFIKITETINEALQEIINDTQLSEVYQYLQQEIQERKSSVSELSSTFEKNMNEINSSLEEFRHLTKRFKRDKSDLMILKNSFTTDIDKLNTRISLTDEDISSIVFFCARLLEYLKFKNDLEVHEYYNDKDQIYSNSINVSQDRFPSISDNKEITMNKFMTNKGSTRNKGQLNLENNYQNASMYNLPFVYRDFQLGGAQITKMKEVMMAGLLNTLHVEKVFESRDLNLAQIFEKCYSQVQATHRNVKSAERGMNTSQNEETKQGVKIKTIPNCNVKQTRGKASKFRANRRVSKSVLSSPKNMHKINLNVTEYNLDNLPKIGHTRLKNLK
ncbi:unnamed protein product [Moneuplotes crassus]|uniref:Uncharacterized protein n=1 Tax=Euplotes crassus TaxID=5936 RepID=A0AAD1Y8G2_EUPCR|nr:unnamed protein product [Moneuplotes crassus]